VAQFFDSQCTTVNEILDSKWFTIAQPYSKSLKITLFNLAPFL